MNIAFDAKRLTHNGTGLGNYSRFVINALSNTFPENKYMLFSPGKGQRDLYEELLRRPSIDLSLPEGRLQRRFPALWRSKGLVPQVLRRKADIFHGLSNELPYGLGCHIPTILTVHDLIYLRYPDYYKPIDRLLYRHKYASSAKRADAIVAISETTKADIINFFGIAPEKISVIYQGCSPRFAEASDLDAERIRRQYGLPEHFVLYVGSIERRKNLALAVEALAQTNLPDLHLTAIGKSTPYVTEIKEICTRLHLQQRVHLLHDIPFADLPGFYRAADVFCYPSRFEGFGIPVIEALSAGTPVVAATGSCLEEAGGNAQLYTDPDNATELAEMLRCIVLDAELQCRMVEEGQIHIARFRPKVIAQDLMSLYNTFL